MLTAEWGLINSCDPFSPFGTSPKLPDLESKLAPALDPLVDVAIDSDSGGSFRVEFMGAGPDFPPGVANRSDGGIGLLLSIGTCWPSDVPFTTGRALGDGGIPRLRAGLRGPALPPGTGGRNKGAGLDILSTVVWCSGDRVRSRRRPQMRGGERTEHEMKSARSARALRQSNLYTDVVEKFRRLAYIGPIGEVRFVPGHNPAVRCMEIFEGVH